MKTAAIHGLPAGSLVIALLAAIPLSGASFGTVNLPASLADAGTQVLRAAVSTPRLTQWCEGPAVARNGTLYFSEQTQGNIWKVTPAGAMTKLVNIGAYSNGIDFNPLTGRMVVCERGQIAERDTGNGAVLSIIAQDGAGVWTGGGSGGANDLSFAANGDLYYTSWNSRIYFRSHNGSVVREWNFPSAAYGTCQWNGIEYVEEKGIVYVAQYGKNRVVSFKADPATHLIDTGTMKQIGPAIYAPDGITVDSAYHVYVCSNNGSAQNPYPHSVVVLDSSGTVLGSIRMSQSAASAAVNCAFGTSMAGGGPNARTLYVTGDSGAFKVQLKIPGRIWPGVSKVRPARRDVAAAAIGAGIAVVRCGNGVKISATAPSNLTVRCFSPSGKALGALPIRRGESRLWIPPSPGLFILKTSTSAGMTAVTLD